MQVTRAVAGMPALLARVNGGEDLARVSPDVP